MVVAGGFIEVNEIINVDNVVNELKNRQIGIDEVEAEKIMFYLERENIEHVKSEIGLIKGIDGIKNVYLTYYSYENGKGSIS